MKNKLGGRDHAYITCRAPWRLMPWAVAHKSAFFHVAKSIVVVCFFCLSSSCGGPQQVASLHGAVARGDVKAIAEIVNWAPGLIDQPRNDISLELPIHTAAIAGQTESGEILISFGARLDSHDIHKNSPLHLASRYGKETFVKMLVIKKADINAKNSANETPLILACRNGSLPVVKLLTENGADTKSRDAFGNALHWAIEFDHSVVVQHLLNLGSPTRQQTSDGYSEIDLASLKGHRQIAKILRNHGEEATVFYFAAFGAQIEMKDAMERNKWDLCEIRDARDNNPLHYAAMHNSTPMIEYLLKKGVSISQRNKSNRLPLHLAAIAGDITKVAPLAIEEQIDAKDYLGRTSLYYAVFRDDAKMAETLLKYGANPNIPDDNGKTPLAIARKNGSDRIVNILLEYGAN